MALCCLLLAQEFGLIQDRENRDLVRQESIAEALASSLSALLHSGSTEPTAISRYLEQVVGQQDSIAALALYRNDGSLWGSAFDASQGQGLTPPPTELAAKVAEKIFSSEVPNPSGGAARLEIQFTKPPAVSAWVSYLPSSLVLPLFLASVLLLGYHWYLHSIFRHLIPSHAISLRVREAFDSLAEGVLVLNENEQVVLANRAFEAASGQSTGDLIGKRVCELPFIPKQQADDQHLPWKQSIAQDSFVRGSLICYGENSKTFSVNSAPIRDKQGRTTGVLASFEDVTVLERKKDELGQLVERLHRSREEVQRQNRELEKLANQDPLTGCHNRRSFFELFDSLWLNAQRLQSPLSVVMLDIDHFKSINDKFGHCVGDEVLKKVAETLKTPLRESDLLCRYGGEEFVIVMPQTRIEQAAIVCERLRLAIAEIEFGELRPTASFGLSASSESPRDPQELLNQADRSLYVAKHSGRNQTVRWDRLSDRQRTTEHKSVRALTKPKPTNNTLTIPFHAVSALLSALAYRDQLTAAHSRRVADLCVAASEGLLSLRDTYTLEMAALLHDIGKIGVPDAILLKPGRLSEDERRIMDSHTRIGCEIVQSSFGSAELTRLVKGAQRRYDATLESEDSGSSDIPIGARLLAIADAYDAMTSEKHYRNAMSHQQAAEELRRNAGTQFDPKLVEHFLKIAADLSRPSTLNITLNSSELALSLGAQMEALVTALEAQDLPAISSVAARVRKAATAQSATNISGKAQELEQALHAEADFVVAMQIASELVDLCRSTQAALLHRPNRLATDRLTTDSRETANQQSPGVASGSTKRN